MNNELAQEEIESDVYESTPADEKEVPIYLRCCGGSTECALQYLKYVEDSSPIEWAADLGIRKWLIGVRGLGDGCFWLTQVGEDCARHVGPRCDTLPFCEANPDYPVCDKFLSIYAKCEKLLADATSKSAL